ncbi:MAG: carboxyl transferase domain-containing protein, partial [Burkholderiaceae bacterium]
MRSPLQAQIVQWHVQPGDVVAPGALLVVLEAMKMEHEVRAEAHARVTELFFGPGETADEGAALLNLVPQAAQAPAPPLSGAAPASADPAAAGPVIRADLRKVIDRHAFTLDTNRPQAVAKRHRLGLRMARENIADLCDADSFVEYGALTVAAQSGRRSADDLIRNTPADGMVTGIGSVNSALFGAEKSRTVVLAYDATVLAGTQGKRNHQKTDRLLGIALQNRLPVVLFAEGGGGRPGDTDSISVAGLHGPTWVSFGRLNGVVPVVGVVAGRCFAGNAAMLGCCDVIIATRDSNIGMGGPAMVEGGGLGVYTPEQIGPSGVQSANGVIDLL